MMKTYINNWHNWLDGADAIMLSGETAKGAYPVKSVEMMSSIAKHAEASIPDEYSEQLKLAGRITTDPSEVTAIACCEAAQNVRKLRTCS